MKKSFRIWLIRLTGNFRCLNGNCGMNCLSFGLTDQNMMNVSRMNSLSIFSEDFFLPLFDHERMNVSF